MFQTPYEKGVSARKMNKGIHENPFIREPSWSETFFELTSTARTTLNLKKLYWDKGWTAQDEFMKKETQSRGSTSV